MVYAKMKRSFKKLWLSALRSGKYEQGKGQLHDSYRDRFCCLGVLCDIAGTGEPGTYGLPSDSTLGLVGLDYGAACYLASMNDDEGKTFEEIAAWIEENL